MYVYYVISCYDSLLGMRSVRLKGGEAWSTFLNETTPVWVHPELDFHYIRGQLFIDNKQANLMECPPNYRIKDNGVFILAHNYDMALELLRP